MNNTTPLVTVVCLCYNQADFVSEALDSVFNQTYDHVELIVVDDCSDDLSVNVIENLIADKPAIKFIKNTKNIGNCKSFNQALVLASGKYIIDLAADDILLPQKISLHVQAFEEANPNCGLIFTNGYYINEIGTKLHLHYTIDFNGSALTTPPSGNIFTQLFLGHFICSPSVMFKKDILIELGGYDESLAYEDFDIWMRIARKYSCNYLDKITIAKRVVAGSLSSKFYNLKNNRLLESTLIICKKAISLSQNETEKRAIAKFIVYHFKLAYFTNNFEICNQYYQLLSELATPKFHHKTIYFFSKKMIKLGAFYLWYISLRLKTSKL